MSEFEEWLNSYENEYVKMEKVIKTYNKFKEEANKENWSRYTDIWDRGPG